MQNKLFEFFRGDSKLIALYDELIKELKILPHLTIKTRKSYSKMVVFCNHKNYSYISLLNDNGEFINCGFKIIFSMCSRISNERIIKITEPFEGHFSHHVVIASATDIDEQLINWLKESYAMA